MSGSADVSPARPDPVLLPAAGWQRWWRQRAASEDPLLRAAAAQGFVLTTAQLRAVGVSRQQARAKVARGRWSAPIRGAVAPLDVDDPSDRHLSRRRHHALAASALCLQRADHVVSGSSSAVLHGVPVFRVRDVPHLTSAESTGRGRRGSGHLRSATLHIEDVTTWFGVPVTTVDRTLVDLARHDRWDAIIAADAALREGLVHPARMALAVDDARGWPGIRQAREVLEFADPRSESPLESLTRLRLRDDGFPRPQLQAWIGRDRVDFLFRAQRLVLEADGRGKYVGDAWWEEKLRERRLRRLGFEIERVVWDDVVHDWRATSDRLRAALRLRASGG